MGSLSWVRGIVIEYVLKACVKFEFTILFKVTHIHVFKDIFCEMRDFMMLTFFLRNEMASQPEQNQYFAGYSGKCQMGAELILCIYLLYILSFIAC